jgi:hypothetical protein
MVSTRTKGHTMQNHDTLIGVIMLLAALVWLVIGAYSHLKGDDHE